MVVERLRRDPPHPSCHIREICKRMALSVPEPASLIGLPTADLVVLIDRQVRVMPKLALRLEVARWPSAELGTRPQFSYNLAQVRLWRTQQAA